MIKSNPMTVACATMEEGRAAIRAIKRERGLPPGGITVTVTAGDHLCRETFELTAEDSGTAAAPVVFRAPPSRSVRFLGGRSLTGFRPVTDRNVLARLTPAARRHVKVVNLADNGVTDLGRMQSRGFSRPLVPASLELFFRGEPMPLARWPNVDFVTIAGLVKETSQDDGWGQAVGALESGFYFPHERLQRWSASDDIWMHGYWCWDWANSYERVVSMDRQTGLIRTAEPYGLYGFRTGQRFYFLNVLEELDQPGEWYVDRAEGLLYFWPPAPCREGDVWVSIQESPLIRLAGAEHVRLEGFDFEYVRGHGIQIEGGRDVTLAGCGFRNIGNYAIVIEGGVHHRVTGCEVAYTGDGGVKLTGGDRATLTPCGHEVVNCHMHHFSRWSRCYCPAILAEGVGMRFAHNYLHDAPHTAVLFSGNEFMIEFNEIHSVCMETGDAGAIYLGRDYTFRGNVVRHNFIHHMGGVGMGTMGVYNDDCVSGTRMEGNVFYRCTRAAMLGGGRDLKVINNLFVDCFPAINFDARGVSPNPVWQRMVYETMKFRAESVRYVEPPYATRYPELKDLKPYLDGKDGVPPEHCAAERNICVGGEWLRGELEAAKKWLRVRRNWMGERGVRFADPTRLDFRIRSAVVMRQIGFKPIPVGDIGLRKDAFRRRVPTRELVHVFLELGRAPVQDAGGRIRPGLMRVNVENPGGVRASGEVALWVDPKAADAVKLTGRHARGVWSYSLKPGMKKSWEVSFTLAEGHDHVELGVYKMGEAFIRHGLRIRPIRERARIGLLRLSSGLDFHALAESLAVTDVHTIRIGTEIAAELWVGLVGRALGVRARVWDKVIRQERPAWKGSCLEVFAVEPGRKKIGHVFLVPASGSRRALARCADGETEGPAPEVRVRSAPTEGGYELTALIPLATLGVGGRAATFMMEFQVSTSPGGVGARQYGTLFGSRSAYQDASEFALVNVRS